MIKMPELKQYCVWCGGKIKRPCPGRQLCGKCSWANEVYSRRSRRIPEVARMQRSE